MAKVINFSEKEMLRIKAHAELQGELTAMTDTEMMSLLDRSPSFNANFNNTKSTIELRGTKVFVKKLHLSKLETVPTYFTSTSNMFELPLSLQYDMCSPGAGAWRELLAATMATNWVLASECPNFPMMYYWRVLPRDRRDDIDQATVEEVKQAVRRFSDAEGLANRYELLMGAEHDVVLFMEHIPSNLREWLLANPQSRDAAAESIFSSIDAQLAKITQYIREHGMLHLACHFDNILTDGEQLFLADFRHSICTQFELTPSEMSFYKRHERFDELYMQAYLVNTILASEFTVKDWYSGEKIEKLELYLAGASGVLPPYLDKLVHYYKKSTTTMNDFFLRYHQSKEARFHANARP